MSYKERLEVLQQREYITECNMRTCYMLMQIALKQLKCVVTAMRYAQQGKDTYAMLQQIKKEIKLIRDVLEGVTITQNDDKMIKQLKFESVKKEYDKGNLNKYQYLKELKKLKSNVA